MIGRYAFQALRLAARPGGLDCPQMRAAIPTSASAGKLLLKLFEEGLLDRTGSVRSFHYTLTPAGRAVLEREELRISAQPKAPKPLPPQSVQRATWKKAPMQGSPVLSAPARVHRLQPVPVSAGYDNRFQVDAATFEGGEFIAEWRRLRGLE